MNSDSATDNPPKRVVFRKRFHGLRSLPLQRFAEELSNGLAGGRDFACLLTSAEELEQLNAQFRGKQTSTDVLSFPSSPNDSYLGDIAISVPHARGYAKQHGHTTEVEVRILMLHGMLHLLGLDHESDGGAMRRAEGRWRKKFGLPHGLIERTR